MKVAPIYVEARVRRINLKYFIFGNAHACVSGSSISLRKFDFDVGTFILLVLLKMKLILHPLCFPIKIKEKSI